MAFFVFPFCLHLQNPVWKTNGLWRNWAVKVDNSWQIFCDTYGRGTIISSQLQHWISVLIQWGCHPKKWWRHQNRLIVMTIVSSCKYFNKLRSHCSFLQPILNYSSNPKKVLCALPIPPTTSIITTREVKTNKICPLWLV